MRYFLAVLSGLLFAMVSNGQTITANGPLSFCAGGNVILGVNPSTNITAYQWIKDGANIIGATASTFFATATGVYTVLLKRQSKTDTTIAPVQVTSNPIPSPPTFTISNNNQCASSPVVFDIVTPLSGASYDWNFGDLTTGVGTNPSHLYNAIGNGTSNYTVSVKVKSAAGCVSAAGSQSITLKQKPDASIDDFTNSPKFTRCASAGSSLDFSLDISNTTQTSATNTLYIIDWGDNSASFSGNSLSSLNHVYSALGYFTITHKVTGQNGCISTVLKTVYNGSNPGVGLSSGGSTIQQCTPATDTFFIDANSIKNNPPGTTYTVSYNDGSPNLVFTHPPPLSFVHTFTGSSCGASGANNPNSFYVRIKAENPCGFLDGSVEPITTVTPPKANIGLDSTACVNSTVTFSNTTIAGSVVVNNSCINTTIINWVITPSTGWSITSGSLGISNPSNNPAEWGSQNLSVKFNTPGYYSIKIIARNSSNPGSPCRLDSITKNICITTPPVPGFTLDSSTGCAPATIQVTNTTVFDNICVPPSYKWIITYTPAFCETTGSGAFTFTNNTSDTSANPAINFTKAGSYTITQNVTNACGTFTSTKTVSIQKPPTVTINLPFYSCGIVNITPGATVKDCSISPSTYAWTFDGGTPATANTANPGIVTFTTLGIHKITLAVTNDCGTTIDTDTVEVTTTPDVVVPANDTLCGGTLAGAYNFTSTIGTPAYNWTNSNPAIGLPATGIGSIPAFTAINNGAIPVTAVITVTPSVSNCVGLPLAFSITVNPRAAAPGVVSPVTYCQNEIAATLTATAAGTNTLTWYTNAGLTGGSITAPTPSTATATTTNYFVTQTNSFGCVSPASTITINVNPGLTGNTISSNQTICANTAPNGLTGGNAAGGNGSYTYQWQGSTDGGNAWVNIAGANNTDYSPGVLTDTIQYRRVVTSAPCSDTSNIITINVQGALNNFGIATSQIICEGFAPALLQGQLPNGGGGVYNYQWQSSVDNLLWPDIPGASLQDYQPPALTITTFYRRRVITPQCSVTSPAITITVNPTPSGSITVAAPFICVEDAGAISFTASIGTAAFDAVLVTTKPGGVTDTTRQSVNSNGPQKIQVIPAGSNPGNYSIRLVQLTDSKGCISNTISSPVIIAVITPVINVIEKDTTICNGQTVIIRNNLLQGGSATGQDSLYTYQWESAPANTTNWQNISGANLETVQVSPAFSTCYRRKVLTNGKCQSISNPVCITVNPGLSNNIISATQQVCVNTPVSNLQGSTPAGGDNNYLYQWETSTDSVNWTGISNTISYQPPVYTAAGTHYFRRSVTSGNCTSASNVIIVRVRPDAKAIFTANPLIGCAPFNLANAITVGVLPDSVGTYNWYADGVLFGSNSSGIFPAYSIINPGDTVDIKLVTLSQFGCKADTTRQQFITPRTAFASFTKDTAKGCGPLNVTFNNTSNIIDNTVQFFWDFGNGIKSQLEQPGTITFNTSPFFNDTTYQITLKAYNGCDTTTWRDSVKIRSNPSARFGVSTTFGCSPFTLVVDNTSLGGPSTYYWDFGNGHRDTTFTNGQLSYTYNIGNVVDTFPVRLIAVNECGIDTQIVDIRIAPNVIRPQVIINGSDLFGCAPHTVSFINATTGATTYTWSFGDNSAPLVTNSSQSTILHTYNTPGVFTVQIDMSNGCSDTAIFRQVTVYQKPVAAFTTNAPVYCLGDSVRVNNTSINATNYQWFWGDGQVSATDNPVHVFAVAGDYTVKLKADKSNSSGSVCFDTAVRNITVLVKPNPFIQSNINTVNCAPFTYTASAPGVTSEAVTWIITDTTVSPSVIILNGINTQYIFKKAGTFTVKMIATNILGCKDSSQQIFTVRGTPTAGFTPLNLSVCRTDTTVQYTNTSTTNDNGPITYRWIIDGNQVSTNANFTFNYSVPGVGSLPKLFNTSLVVTNTVGCSDTAKGTVQLAPTAKANFSIANPNDCLPFIATLVDNTTNATNYQWYVDGVFVSNAPTPVITITDASKLYKIKLVASNQFSCRPDSFEISFTTRRMPVAAFISSDTLGCTGVLSVATTNRSSFANFYTWDWGDASPTTSFVSPSHFYNTGGQYVINLVAGDGTCSDTATQLVRVSTKPLADFAVSNTITCDTARIEFTNLTQNGKSYLWSFGDGTTSVEVDPVKNFAPSLSPYTVKLVADDGLGCKDSLIKANLITAKVPPVADFFISPTPVITVPNYTFSFTNITQNSSKYVYQWDIGDGTSFNTRDIPSHKYADTGNYPIRLVVLDTSTNCPDTMIRIARIDGFPGWLYVPNAICPNCIQSNVREFLPKGKGLKDYQLQIFTTWGELIFETKDIDATGAPTKSWDGRYKGVPVSQDVYVWKIFARFMNGSEWLGMLYPGEGQYKKTGTVTVVR